MAVAIEPPVSPLKKWSENPFSSAVIVGLILMGLTHSWAVYDAAQKHSDSIDKFVEAQTKTNVDQAQYNGEFRSGITDLKQIVTADHEWIREHDRK